MDAEELRRRRDPIVESKSDRAIGVRHRLSFATQQRREEDSMARSKKACWKPADVRVDARRRIMRSRRHRRELDLRTSRR